jgi:hypothetical protein
MNKTYLLLFLACCLLSCSKSDIFYNGNPNIEIRSVQYYMANTSNPMCNTVYLAIPSDTSVYTELDIDGDQKNDFRFEASHNPYLSYYCGHCPQYNYYLKISSLSAENFICLDKETNKPFQYHATINKKADWTSSANLKEYVACSGGYDLLDGYIGLKINDHYGYIGVVKLDNNGIGVTEYGLNRSQKISIRCGEM